MDGKVGGMVTDPSEQASSRAPAFSIPVPVSWNTWGLPPGVPQAASNMQGTWMHNVPAAAHAAVHDIPPAAHAFSEGPAGAEAEDMSAPRSKTARAGRRQSSVEWQTMNKQAQNKRREREKKLWSDLDSLSLDAAGGRAPALPGLAVLDSGACTRAVASFLRSLASFSCALQSSFHLPAPCTPYRRSCSDAGAQRFRYVGNVHALRFQHGTPTPAAVKRLQERPASVAEKRVMQAHTPPAALSHALKQRQMLDCATARHSERTT